MAGYPKGGALVYTIIVKPTKHCNADCSYCSAPPDGYSQWSFEDFKKFWDKVEPSLGHGANIIWHGGEPMLLGPDFYLRAFEYKNLKRPDVNFSIQSNILLYEREKWFDVFSRVMGGRISTSYDPDQQNRSIKGSTQAYTDRFWQKISELADDGFYPLVIGTYTTVTAAWATRMYDRVLAMGERGFPLRFNYRYPAGRDSGMGELISPQRYGKMLIDLYDKWIVDVPSFSITPLDQMLRKVIGVESARCPWTKACGGRFLGVEPNGDTYNCSEFADIGDSQYRFGNIFRDEMSDILSSRPAVLIRRRQVDLPPDCFTCRHFEVCEGGCARDAVLYERGLGGKFYYCQSWKMVFDRIKESVRTGEADAVIARFGRTLHQKDMLPLGAIMSEQLERDLEGSL